MNSHSNIKYRAYIDEIRDNLKVTLQKGLEFINWGKYIDKNSRVFVKPNFTFPDLPPKNWSSYNVSPRVRKGVQMVRKTFAPEQIINRLREVEVLISQGATTIS